MPFDATPTTEPPAVAAIDRVIEFLACRRGRNGAPARYCILGATYTVPKEMQQEIQRAVSRATGVYDIVGWNDADGRTHEQVMEMLAEVRRKLVKEMLDAV